MRVSNNKQYNDFVTKLLRAGWTIIRKGKHHKLLTPEGKIAGWVSTSPSDGYRGFLNFKSEVLRRACA